MPKARSLARKKQRRVKLAVDALRLEIAEAVLNIRPCVPSVPLVPLDTPESVAVKDETFVESEIINSRNSSDSEFNLSADSHSVNSSTDDDGDCSFTGPEDIPDMLREWSSVYKISNAALSNLLTILKVIPDLKDLPSDSRTLLNTPRLVVTYPCAGGKMAYFGIAHNLTKIIENNLDQLETCQFRCVQSISGGTQICSISVNADGLPISDSSSLSFWPILGVCDQMKNKKPFVIALYQGKQKPSSSNDFLEKFVTEAKELEDNGLIIGKTRFIFRVSCILADTPARSFLKNVVQFNGFNGCTKCCQLGRWEGRTVWIYQESMDLRTDEIFRDFGYSGHQLNVSLLTNLKIGLVSQFPLDYMHLVCLGVTKKLISSWIGQKCPRHTKLSQTQIDLISQRLLALNVAIPNFKEFRRRPRPIEDYKFWKAAEFRMFLIYLGPIVLSGVLSPTLYIHFLTLSVAVYIAIDPSLATDKKWNSYANELLHLFVKQVEPLYGKQLLVSNFHNLLHLMADVENFGPLDNFSCFPYENFMQTLKGWIRGPNKQLEQVCKRIKENEYKHFTRKSKDTQNVVRIYRGQICYLQSPDIAGNTVIRKSEPDNCFLVKKDTIVLIQAIIKCADGNFIFQCKELTEKSDFFSLPLPSSRLSIFKIDKTVITPHTFELRATDFVKKCMLLPLLRFDSPNYFVCIPYASMQMLNRSS